jgi:glutamate synthase (NADPH/NADH) large chain
MPVIEQVFIQNSINIDDQESLERRLYLVRKKLSNDLRNDGTLKDSSLFYINSLSSKTIFYKGMLTCNHLS